MKHLIIILIIALAITTAGAAHDYNPRPFQSYEELVVWVEDYEPMLYFWGGVDFESVDCEDYAIAMMVTAINDGYLLSMDLHEELNHVWIMVPIFSENKWYFIEPTTKRITDRLNGRIWTID